MNTDHVREGARHLDEAVEHIEAAHAAGDLDPVCAYAVACMRGDLAHLSRRLAGIVARRAELAST